jgi:hypothetical protein
MESFIQVQKFSIFSLLKFPSITYIFLVQGMLKHIDGYVMKPVQNNERGKTEIEFYEQIFQSSHPVISKLKQIVPHFFGLHQFVSDTASNII